MRVLPASIRGRLILNLGLGLLLLLTGAALLLEHKIESGLLRLFDRALFEKARTFATLIEWEEGWVEVNYSADNMPEFLPGAESQYFLVMDGDSTLARSASLGAGGPKLRIDSDHQAEPGFHNMPLPDGRPGRLVVFRFMPLLESDPSLLSPSADMTALAPLEEGLYFQGAPRPLILLHARERESLNQQIRDARRTLALALGGAWLLVMLVVAVLVRHELKPLTRLAREVGGLDSATLDRRVGSASVWAQELRPIVGQLNLLLERLEAAFRREQQFSAHVAHELRTPVAELRSIADVSRRLVSRPDALSPLLEDLDSLSRQMEGMVASLLELARSEVNGQAPSVEPIRLPDWLLGLVATLNPDGKHRIEWLASSPVVLMTNEAALGMILHNLLGNAFQHGAVGQPVKLGWQDDRGRAAIVIENSAPGLAPSDLPQLRERFWRGDPARASGESMGLGLSISQALAARHHLSLELTLDADGRFRARVGGIPT